MIDLKKHKSLLDENIKVALYDGQVLVGKWSDWISEADNEPDPEAIIIETKDKGLVEIYVFDIKHIEKV